MNSPVDPYQSSDSSLQGLDAKKPGILRRILKWFAYLLGFILLGIVLLVFWALNEQSEYESTAVPYIEQLIPKIATWDPDVVWDSYDQEVRDSISEEDNEKVVRFMSRLGALESIGTPAFQQVSKSASTGSGTRKFVSYQVPAKFENGDASIDLTLVDRDAEFCVYYFKINSLAFVDDESSTAESETEEIKLEQ